MSYSVYGYPRFKGVPPRSERVTTDEEMKTLRDQMKADGYLVRIYMSNGIRAGRKFKNQ